MHYLVTDQDCKTWRGYHWGPGVTNTEENPNYFFAAYTTPEKALLMYPAYEDFSSARLWVVEGENSKPDHIRQEYKTFKCHGEYIINQPTHEQIRSFAICCCLILVDDKDFKEWCHRWLRNEDRTSESAMRIQKALIDRVGGEAYMSCAHACVTSTLVESPSLFAANAAHRAYYDSPQENRLDLDLISSLAMTTGPSKLSDLFTT